mmetsp:Transcript_14466/g.21475  ORF Transcript_14466/g.21475 Transcript_14466/m.21475 type:complete len:279 (+) Transcript_14466:94-930(+)
MLSKCGYRFLYTNLILSAYLKIGVSLVVNSRELASCPTGGILDSSGDFCCPSSCGSCGGSGCGELPGGTSSCCTSQFKNSCDDGALPCKITSTDDGTDTELPYPDKYCTGGILSDICTEAFCPFRICCPLSCESCDSEGISCLQSPECCAINFIRISETNDANVSCRNKGPPCLVPPEDDPCEINPCQNGARCGVSLPRNEDECIEERVICMCEEIGNFSGEYCEIECGFGETPCGNIFATYYSYAYEVNDVCCKSDQQCMKDPATYLFTTCTEVETS